MKYKYNIWPLVVMVALMSLSAAARGIEAFSSSAEHPVLAESDFSRYHYYPLEAGYQGALPGDPVRAEFGDREYFAYFYRLPAYSNDHQLLLYSLVKDKAFFYPSKVLLLSQGWQILKEVPAPEYLEHLDGMGRGAKLEIPVTTEVAYLVIATYSGIQGKPIHYVEEVSTSVPVSDGRSVYYVSGPSRLQRRSTRYSPVGEVMLLTPYDRNPQPFIRQQGGYIDFGATFGGAFVASNPGGDNYNAGSGALVGGGYAWQLFDSQSWLGRLSLDGRYQGGKGRSQGVVAQGALIYSTAHVNLGLGLYADMYNSIKDINGVLTEFEDALGASVILEWRMLPTVSVELRYTAIDYETTQGVAYDGNQAAITMKVGL